MSEDVAKITRLDLNEVWRHEAHNFTPWLAEYIDRLSEVLGFELSDPETEQSSGDFSVDIVAKCGDDTVVIENQYGRSDHKHLGQLLTYLAAHDAKKAIWIMEDPRPEHIDALTWLDERNNDCEFYLVKAEAIKIDGSRPALLLTKIVGPNIEKKKIVKATTEKDAVLFKFWSQLLEKSNKEFDRFNNVSPGHRVHLSAGAGRAGVTYVYWVHNEHMKVELRIRGTSSEDAIDIFEQLKNKGQNFVDILETGFTWEEEKENRMRALRKVLRSGGTRSDEAKWAEIIEEAVGAMKTLEAATKGLIASLKETA